MTVETFFGKFELFADAPNAVQKLRELILDSAVSGRLHANAEPHWRAAKLGEVVQLISGQHLLAHEQNSRGEGIPYLTGPSDFGAVHPTASRWTDSPKAVAEPGDILITVKGSGVGKTNVLKAEQCAIGRQLMALRVKGVDRDFIHIVLRRAASHFQDLKTGIAIPGIGRSEILDLNMTLPPLAEQKRIVAKVDELMALCDRLEAQQQERAAKHVDLARAALARFADEPTPANLEFLFYNSYGIDPADIRQAILTMAVRGRLVQQDAGDESALVLLRQIETHKRALASAGKLRGTTAVHPLGDSESDPTLPPGWALCRFGDLMVNRDGERIPVSKEQRETKQKVYDYYGASGVIDKIDGFLFDKPLLLIGEDGANLINRSTPIAFIARGKYWVNNHAHVLDGLNEDLLRFIELQINSIDLKPYVTGTAQPKMNQAKMNSIPLAVPPIAEQRRIVAKVDQLMALVDRLETQLAKSRTAAERLMEAVVAELTRSPLDGDEFAAVEEKPDPAAARIAAAGRFACYVVRRLHDDPEFGRTKLEKCNHLAESHCGVPLDRHAFRGAHGPVDYALLKDAERWAEAHGGFTTDDPGDGHRVEYTPGPSLAAHVAAAEAWLGDRKAEVDRLLEFLRPLKTRDCEVVATVYAAWNDLLLAGQSPNDRDILREAKHNWHEKKESISDTQWFRALRRLESHDFRPKGIGRPVPRRA